MSLGYSLYTYCAFLGYALDTAVYYSSIVYFLHITVYHCVLLNHCYVHAVTPKEVMDLEKTYWGLKGSGKFDCETFKLYITPPVPQELCEGERPFVPRPLAEL